MAVSAKFSADFASFSTAVNKADVELKGFETDANKVEKSLKAMGNSLSGTKLVQDASLMAKAVEDLGGVSKLTEKELARVGSTAQEAVAKLKALGQDVPPGIQAIATEAKGAGGALQGMLGTVASLGATLGIGLSVGAAVGFGRAILEDAGALEKMAEKTGISLQGLQKLQIVGDESGNTIEDLTNAVNKMQNKLAGDDKSALAAVDKLGLSLSTLKGLAPDQQFMALGEAIRGVQDPAERVNIAMALFGKAGAEVLPSIMRGFDDVKDASVGMSDATVKALKSVDDAWKRTVREAKASTGEFLAAIIPSLERAAYILKLLGGQGGLIVPAPGPGLPKPAGSPNFGKAPTLFPNMEPPNAATGEMFLGRETEALRKNQEAATKAAEAKHKLQEEEERLVTSTDALEHSMGMLTGTLQGVPQASANAFNAFHKGLIDFDEAPNLISKAFGPGSAASTALAGLGQETADLSQKIHESLGSKLKKDLDGMNDIFQRAFEGGGGVGAAIKSFSTGIIRDLTDMIPVVGPIVSKFAGAIVAGFSRLFGGPSKTELAGRDVQAQFQASFGGFQQMLDAVAKAYVVTGRGADKARQDVERLMAAEKKGADAVKAVMGDITSAFDLQKTATETLTETLSRYKFTTEELGPALAGQKLHEQSVQLYKDWEVLTQTGINLGAGGREMQAGIEDFVTSAIKTKTEVDPALKPMLQSMLDMGLLTDEAGNQFTSLDAAGLKFSATMSDVVDSVRELTDVLRRGLGLAVDDTISRIGKIPKSIDIDVNYKDPGGGGFGGGPAVPSNVLPFVPKSSSAAASSGGATLSDVVQLLKRQPESTAIAVRDALLKSGRA